MRKLTLTLLALLTVLVVVLAPVSPVRADSPEHLTKKAFLRNRQTGDQVEIPIDVQQEHLQDGRDLIKYFAGIPRELLGVTTAIKKARYIEPPKEDSLVSIPPNDEHSYGSCDGSYSVCSTLYQYFSTNGNYVAIDYAKGKWDRMDSQVSWSNAYLEATCYGLFLDTGFCNSTERYNVGSPSSGQWYYQYPSWRNRYVETGDVAYVAERMQITITRGGSSWNFGFCISEGGSSILSCH